MIDKSLLDKRFGSAAKQYDRNAILQKKICEGILDQIKTIFKRKDAPRMILEIGCGTGWMTKELGRYFPNSQILAIDLSSGMIDYAKKNSLSDNIRFFQADAEKWVTDNRFDLIISASTFQWLHDPYTAVTKFTNFLNKNGVFILSTFGSRTFFEIESYLSEKLPPSTDSPIIGSAHFLEKSFLESTLQKTGLPNAIVTEDFQMQFDTPRLFFSSLRAIGANSSSPDRIRNNIPRMRLIQKHLNDMRVKTGSIPVDYEILTVIIGER